jgi:hypothetical protein
MNGISGCKISEILISENYEILKDLGEGTFGSVKLGKSI